MTSGNAWRAEKAARRTLTPLNQRTSAAYADCEGNGGHHGSGRYVYRDFAARLLYLEVCAACGVPMHAPRMSSSAQRGGRA